MFAMICDAALVDMQAALAIPVIIERDVASVKFKGLFDLCKKTKTIKKVYELL